MCVCAAAIAVLTRWGLCQVVLPPLHIMIVHNVYRVCLSCSGQNKHAHVHVAPVAKPSTQSVLPQRGLAVHQFCTHAGRCARGLLTMQPSSPVHSPESKLEGRACQLPIARARTAAEDSIPQSNTETHDSPPVNAPGSPAGSSAGDSVCFMAYPAATAVALSEPATAGSTSQVTGQAPLCGYSLTNNSLKVESVQSASFTDAACTSSTAIPVGASKRHDNQLSGGNERARSLLPVPFTARVSLEAPLSDGVRVDESSAGIIITRCVGLHCALE